MQIIDIEYTDGTKETFHGSVRIVENGSVLSVNNQDQEFMIPMVNIRKYRAHDQKKQKFKVRDAVKVFYKNQWVDGVIMSISGDMAQVTITDIRYTNNQSGKYNEDYVLISIWCDLESSKIELVSDKQRVNFWKIVK